MRALRFVLKGRTAFFKNPEVNSYFYFTYGNIHKPALLGIFGAILGYGGYNEQFIFNRLNKDDRKDYPEYYEKLMNLKVSVIPANSKGYFSKKIQQFNNSVGYASAETGGNLIVKEQWLENPEWTVYVLLDCDEAEKLAGMISDNRCIYVPYLGKNDHPADILNPNIIELEQIEEFSGRINSLSLFNNSKFNERKYKFKYIEYLPLALSLETNHYIIEKFVLTDAKSEILQDIVYRDGEKNVIFY